MKVSLPFIYDQGTENMIFVKLKFATGLPEGAFLVCSLLYCAVNQIGLRLFLCSGIFSMNCLGVLW